MAPTERLVGGQFATGDLSFAHCRHVRSGARAGSAPVPNLCYCEQLSGVWLAWAGTCCGLQLIPNGFPSVFGSSG